ncbi:hypothetical protein EI94DRAFT_1802114 [Lactarius quietus]|nr:hypothetical protein EI94DRAFT_1802114 [Lactarius quietus]
MAAKTIKEHSYGNMVDAMSQGPKDAGSQRGLEKEASVPLGSEKIMATNSDRMSKDPLKRKKDHKETDLSLSKKRRHCNMINEWAAGVPDNVAPASRSVPSHITAPTSSCSKTLSKTGVPSLTTGTSRSRSSVPSINSCNVKTVSCHLEVSAGKKAEPKDSKLIAVVSDASLSDNDETKGEERLVTINSPPKGKKQVTSDELVVLKSSKSASNKSSDELPSFIEARWFRATFVSTYMTFIAQTVDPWIVPVAQALEVMQKIWDATSSFKYKIETSSAVYQKTIQHCVDSWQNVIGSTGIVVLLAFFDSQVQFQNSDEECQSFTKDYLEDLHFLYKDSKHEDKKKWKGLFHSPLVIQTFAAHLTATEGAQVVPNLHGPQLEQTPMATGSLGLATVSVERALTLVARGILMITIARVARGKTVTFPHTLNISPSKDSTRQTGFSDAAWGKASQSYAKSARALSIAKFGVIIDSTWVYMKPSHFFNKSDTVPTETVVNEDDECACLIDNSGLDADSDLGSDEALLMASNKHAQAQ